MLKLDYSLQTPAERKELVEKILEENPNPTNQYLEILADYLTLCMEKQEKKERKIMTDNRLSTINKHETSFEGLVSQFENGEDGVYNLISDNNKNTIFQPKIQITKKDIETIPDLKQLREAIEYWEAKLKTVTGKDAYIVKKTIIDLRKDQYIIKEAYLRPIQTTHLIRSKSSICMDEKITVDKNGKTKAEGISLLRPEVCSAILCNYSRLKEDSWDRLDSDCWYLMLNFDDVADRALKDFPIYERIVELKIDGVQNADIQLMLEKEFNTKHSLEYISSLWRKKIPRMIASVAEDDYLDWYYLNVEKGKYKKCSRCGKIKLANNKYFSKNTTSKDGFYSICKECRNKK